MAKKMLISLGGRIAALEEKMTKGGDKYFSGRMVNTKCYKQNDEWKTKENWFSFTAFDKSSVKYLEKASVGDKMLITADLDGEKYKGKTYYNLNILSVVAVTPKESAKHLQDVNICIVIGKKCSDYNTNGNFLNGSIALTKRIKSGEKFENDTQWINITAAGKIAEKLMEKKKGNTLHLEGELQSSSYENKSGETVNTVSVFVTKIDGEVEYQHGEASGNTFVEQAKPQPEEKEVSSDDKVAADFFDITNGTIDDIETLPFNIPA